MSSPRVVGEAGPNVTPAVGGFRGFLRKRQRRATPLDDVMPEYQFRGVVSVTVNATPHRIFQALKEVTLSDMPVAYALGTLRYLPGRLAGKTQDETQPTEPFLDLLKAGGTIILAEQKDREVVLGSIGKYHQILDQQWVPLKAPREFVRFHDPGYQKLAMAIRIDDGSDDNGQRLTVEHRTLALSPSSRRKFVRYWLVIKPTGNFVSWLLLRAIKRRAEANG